jgi:hypothetical protein
MILRARLWMLLVFLIARLAAAADSKSKSALLRVPGSPDSVVSAESLQKAGPRDVSIETEHGGKVVYRAVPLLQILESAGLETEGMPAMRKLAAAIVVATARDGYTAVFSGAELLAARTEPRVFLSAATTSGALSEEQGPVRLVVTGERARSVYGLTRIEVRFVAENKPARKS